jgi:hypothetical protein
MTNRSLCVGLAVVGFALVLGLPSAGSAAPGPILTTAAAELVQPVDYDGKRRWRYRNGTHVRALFASVDSDRDTYVAAPFARVYSGRYGTWVRAPFVNLWVPR